MARAHVQAVRAAAQDATAPPAPLLGPAELAQMEGLLRIGSWYLINPSGPLWFRGYATWTSSEGAKQLPGLLERYGASRFVVGHTPLQTMRITPRFSGQVFLIDTGMLSAFYKGRASALEFRQGKASALYLEDDPIRFDP